jgi:hypothetical protein
MLDITFLLVSLPAAVLLVYLEHLDSPQTSPQSQLADGLFGLDAQDVTYSVLGNKTFTLGGGVDYSATGGMKAELSNLITSYGLFQNKDEIEVDYLIMGPGCVGESDSQAKANYIISLANARKDCVAVVGPHRANLGQHYQHNDSDQQSDQLLLATDFFFVCDLRQWLQVSV